MIRLTLCLIFSALLVACGKDAETKDSSVSSYKPEVVVPQKTEAQLFVESIVPGKEYIYYADGSCTNSEKNVCITEPQYIELCRANSGMTKWASRGLFVGYTNLLRLYDGGDVENSSVNLAESSNYKYKCRVSVTVRGIQDGSSMRKTQEGGASTFIKTDEGILVHYASDFNY